MNSHNRSKLGIILTVAMLVVALIVPPVGLSALASTGCDSGSCCAAAAGDALVVAASSQALPEAGEMTALSTVYVYITRTGTKYHRSRCRNLHSSKRKVTLKYAKSRGYTACKVCKPPR